MTLLAHCGHRLTVMPDSDESAAGLLCETCGEYVFELDDVEIVDALAPEAPGGTSGVVAWLRAEATGERTEDPGSDQLELVADFIERHHPGGQ
jgi:hypothetical protein